MKLIITNETDYKLPKSIACALFKVARMTLVTEDGKRAMEDIPETVEVSLTITDDAGIQRTNLAYRGKDSATDVLSFPQYEVDEAIAKKSSLGDIMISVDTMAAQAKSFGHSQKREMSFLFCHGMLHLLGYDHEISEAEEKAQFARQDEVLAILDIRR